MRLLLPLCLLVSCGPSAPAEDPPTLQHIELALEDGRSPVEVLAERRKRFYRWDVQSAKSAQKDLAPWQLRNTTIVKTGRARGARITARRQGEGAPSQRADLILKGPFQSSQFNVVEVDLIFAGRGDAALRWRNSDEGWTSNRSITVPLVSTATVQTARFSLAENPEWRGQIAGIHLMPVFRGRPQAYELFAIRFLREGFLPGACPDDDGGLVGTGGDLRRAWPGDIDTPLYASVDVPKGGRVEVETAVMGWLAGTDTFRFTIDARSESTAWTTVAQHDRGPAPDDEPAWLPLAGDLSAFAGQSVTLRFRAARDGDENEGLGGQLDLARVLWGRPVVFPERDADPRPNLLLVTLDTLRADALGSYGGPTVTPHLDAFAAEGILYESAFSPSNSTLPSHVSILTGLPVPTHGVADNRSVLDPGIGTLAETLRASGYHTAAAVSVHHLSASYSGLGRGFDQYLDTPEQSDGRRTVDAAVRWLHQWSEGGDRPWFLWVHLFDPHTPYAPPAEFLERFEADLTARGVTIPAPTADPPTVGATPYTAAGNFLDGVSSVDYVRHLYHADVAYTDELFGDLVAALKGTNALARSAVFITSDHGESLGEHDVWFEHGLLFPQTVHVPLIVRAPDAPRGLRVGTCVSGTDIAGTTAGLAGVPGFRDHGDDLLAIARTEDKERRRIWFVHGGLSQVGCRDDLAHFFRTTGIQDERNAMYAAMSAGERQLYLHSEDPGGFQECGAAHPEELDDYAARAEAWFDHAHTGTRVRAATTQDQEDALEALGYSGEE